MKVYRPDSLAGAILIKQSSQWIEGCGLGTLAQRLSTSAEILPTLSRNAEPRPAAAALHRSIQIFEFPASR